MHHCIASWQQPASCSDPLDDYNTLHITNVMANISINLFIMHHCTALVQLHVRIAFWRWNAWKISDVSEHSGGAAMHNTYISAHLLGTLGHYGQACTHISAHLGTLLPWRHINLGDCNVFNRSRALIYIRQKRVVINARIHAITQKCLQIDDRIFHQVQMF